MTAGVDVDRPSSGTDAAPGGAEAGEQAEQAMLRDIDAALGRIHAKLAVEHAAMDALLARLSRNAA